MANRHVPEHHANFSLAELKPYPYNAKIHTDVQIAAIVASIRQFGFQQPIVCDEANMILVGHGRYAAAVQLALKTVPVWRVKDLTEEEKVAFRIADNKIAVETGFDASMLEAEMAKLASVPFDLKPLLLDFSQSGPVERQEDVNDLGERLETYENTSVKQIVLYFDLDTYDKTLSRLHKICADNGCANNTEAVLYLLNEYDRGHN